VSFASYDVLLVLLHSPRSILRYPSSLRWYEGGSGDRLSREEGLPNGHIFPLPSHPHRLHLRLNDP